ncbi:MAG: hypothetical protein OHK0013_11170 [Sandaracinaceae bacterium]
MRIVAVGQHAEGVIAIGQEATGFFALGQFATGVIAIGQVARGVVAIGQLSLGIFTVGQLGLGLSFCAAMIGAGGRALGIVLPLVPVPPRKKKLPPVGPLAAVRSGGAGWVRGTLARGGGTRIVAMIEGQSVPLSVGADLFLAAYYFAKKGSTEPLFLRVSSEGGGLRLLEIKRAEEDRSKKPWLGPLSIVQLVALAIAAGVYWQFFLVDFGDFVVRLAQDAAVNGVTFL